jgi:hypothetical protein
MEMIIDSMRLYLEESLATKRKKKTDVMEGNEMM